MSLPCNGTSIQYLVLLRTTTGRHIHLTCKVTTSDVEEPLQDGGNSGLTRMASSPTRRVEYWMFKAALTQRTETSLPIHFIERLTSNGISSMLMKGIVSLRRESLLTDSVFM
jgi:hypothetical protein